MVVVAGIQARLGSSRLPNKILFPIGGVPILKWVDRATEYMNVDETVILTDLSSQDSIREKIGHASGYDGLVSDRYRKFANEYSDDDFYYVRLCGDQPFVDVDLTNRLIDFAQETNADYAGYMVYGRPSALTSYGIYPEVFKASCLLRSEPSDHVTNTIYMRPDEFNCQFIKHDPMDWAGERLERKTWSDFSLTVDTVLDYYRIKTWHESGGWPKHPGGDPYKNDGRYNWL